jgi:hypothetical protein
MGMNNKARRDAKAKAKARSRRGSGSAGRPDGSGARWGHRAEEQAWSPQAEAVRDLLLLTAEAKHRGDRFADDGIARLASLADAVVDQEAETALLDQIGAIWSGGWQPVELHRQGRRGCPTAAGGRLVALGIAVDHAARRSVTLDARWVAQVEGLALHAVDGRPGWLRRWADAEGLDRPHAVATMVDALANLAHLPRLDPLLPPPGSARSGQQAPWSAPTGAFVGAGADPALQRIRALLAKAESTTFEAEATAFTAKAQELMTRHAIDAAVLQGRSGLGDERPVTIRVPIDAPYADAKSLLLQTVAEHGRCRSVFHATLALSSVVGFPADVAGVEVLFTSLLLQAQRALADAARRAPAGTRTRGQSYRSAFLLAYAVRIGDRLREANESVLATVEAEQGAGFLPVLRSRQVAVDDLMAERFAGTTSSPVRGGYDAAGWASGRVAADRARLTSGDLTDQAATGT